MAQLVVGAIGGVVGFFVGGPVGAAAGFSLGYSIMAGQDAKAPGSSRIQDLRVTGAQYGQSIPWALGAPRMAGQVWWASNKRPIPHSQSAGKGGGSQSSTSYTYEVDLLIGLTDGPISSVTRAWSNGKLVWTNLASATDPSRIASESIEVWKRMTVYNGSTSQLPDPTYEAAVGTGNAPAYRGRSLVFIEGLQLDSGGQVPNLTFEVATATVSSTNITRRAANNATSPLYSNATNTNAGRPAIVSITPYVRVAVLSINDATVYQYQYDGTGLPNSTRTGSSESYPGPAVFGSVATYPLGILGGLPVRFQNLNRPFGSGYGILIVGTQNGTSSGSGELFGFDLTSVLPAGEYLGGVSLCSDGMNAIVFTAPSDATVGGAVLNKWYLISYNGTAATLQRAGTLAVAASIYRFGFGNSAGFHFASTMLEENLTSLWATYTPGGDIYLYTIGLDNILTNTSHLFVPDGLLTNGFGYPSIWAQSGFCVVVWEDKLCTFRRGGDSLIPIRLDNAITALCSRAGLSAAQFDVSSLISSPKVVRALAVAQVGATRAALEQLQTAYQFEAVLSDKLYFRPRGGAAVTTIPYTDLGATSGGASQSQPLPLTIASDLELPPQVAVQYLNDLADQQSATEVSDRLIAGQASLSTVSLGLSLQPTEAKAVADAIVADQLASLITTSLHLTLQYANLEPSDVVQVNDAAGNTHRLRLVKRDDAGGVIAFDAVADDAQAIVSAGTTSSTYTTSGDVVALANTILYPLDIPLLQEADDTPGYYVAANGTTTYWPGCVVMSSADGATYAQAASVDESAVMGGANTALGNWTGGMVFDDINTLTVNVGNGQLASATRDALLADRTLNVLLVGAEVIRFATATLVTTAPNIYTVSRLLRGQLGTDWAMLGHGANERVVLLAMHGLRRVTQKSTEVGLTRWLKGVTKGRTVGATTAQSFINNGVSAKPFAPVDARVSRAFNGDITLTWKRRTRYACTFAGTAGIGVPLDETAELYDIDFYNAAVYDDLHKKLTVTNVAGAQYVHSYYLQFVINALAAPSTLYAVIYQKSGTVRGYGCQVALALPVADGATTNPVVVAASASGYIVQNGTATNSTDGYITFWSASSPTGPYTAAYTSTVANPTGLPAFSMSGGRIAQNNSLVVGFDMSVEQNLSGDRTKTRFILARLDLASSPHVTDTSPYMIRPRAIAGDGSRFLLLGEYNHVFSSPDGVVWTDLGVMSGATFPNAIGDDTYLTQRLFKIGTRWFLVFGRAAATGTLTTLFYTDNADALSGWAAATGIDVDTVSYVMDNIVFDGTYHYAVKDVLTGYPGVYRSSNNGATWTLEYTATTSASFALQCTGTTGSDKVRLYGAGTTHEKTVGTIIWSNFANGLVHPYRSVDYGGHLLVTDNAPAYSGGGSRIAYETGGVFTTVTGF